MLWTFHYMKMKTGHYGVSGPYFILKTSHIFLLIETVLLKCLHSLLGLSEPITSSLRNFNWLSHTFGLISISSWISMVNVIFNSSDVIERNARNRRQICPSVPYIFSTMKYLQLASSLAEGHEICQGTQFQILLLFPLGKPNLVQKPQKVTSCTGFPPLFQCRWKVTAALELPGICDEGLACSWTSHNPENTKLSTAVSEKNGFACHSQCSLFHIVHLGMSFMATACIAPTQSCTRTAWQIGCSLVTAMEVILQLLYWIGGINLSLQM